MERRRPAAVQRDVVCPFSPSASLGNADRSLARYAWRNSRETRARRRAEEAAIAERRDHLASLSNGELDFKSHLASHDHSPSRGVVLLPAISSMRDEPSQPPTPMIGVENGEVLQHGMDELWEGTDLDVRAGTNGNASIHKDIGPGEQVSTNGDVKSTPLASNGETTLATLDTSDAKRALAIRLLDAALTRPEPLPVQTKPAIRRPASSAAKQPPSFTTRELIQLRLLPIDLAVNAARAAMGEGAEEDDLEGLELVGEGVGEDGVGVVG